MESDVNIFINQDTMTESLSEEFYRYVNEALLTRNKLNIALSGGNTPVLFFKSLCEFDQKKANKMDWQKIHFFWGDERCVPPDSKESNYGSAYKNLFSKIGIPESNIHRIEGENDPEKEAVRYSNLLQKLVEMKAGIPVFDWIFLGLGEDGHTASIFPKQLDLINSEKICEIGIHPESGQKRITLTGTVINLAKRITFMAAGTAKQEVISQIINRDKSAKHYPAAKIKAQNGKLDWYLDAAAAEQI